MPNYMRTKDKSYQDNSLIDTKELTYIGLTKFNYTWPGEHPIYVVPTVSAGLARTAAAINFGAP